MTRPPQNILAIDTSTSALRLGLRFNGDRTIQLLETVGRSHGELLINKIADLLKSAGLKCSEVQLIVVCIGPGSFTGLRIGLAAAKGMAAALDCTVIGADIFEVAAHRLREKREPTIVVIPLNRDECFIAPVRDGRYDRSSVRVVPYAEVATLTGDPTIVTVAADLNQRLNEAGVTCEPDQLDYEAADLIDIGLAKWLSGYKVELAELEPLYIQKSQAEIRFEQRRKKQ